MKIFGIIIGILFIIFSIVFIYLKTDLIDPSNYKENPTGLSIFKNKKITIDILNQTKKPFILKSHKIPADTYLKLRYNNQNEKLIINSDINGYYTKTLYYSKFLNKFLSNNLKECKVKKTLFNFIENKKQVLNFLISSENNDAITFDITKDGDKYEVDFIEENKNKTDNIKYTCILTNNTHLITGFDLLIQSSLKR
jgi:hypothetical protein